MERTKPKPLDNKNLPPSELAAKRYGTPEMAEIWGAEGTFSYILNSQEVSVRVISEKHPEIVSAEEAKEIKEAANLDVIDPNRIRELEEKTGHDVNAINIALGEVVSPAAGRHINKFRASADSTETAKGLQLSDALLVIADSISNLRDITLERTMDWLNIPYMDTSHLYDALPTVLGRPFSHYAEMLQSNLDFIEYVLKNSLYGKWADATGNYHSSTAFGIDGRELEDLYCETLGLNHMDAPAQVPGREFLVYPVFALSITSETLNNMARFIAINRSDDTGIFVYPKGKKGSSSMPHKDAKGGNPTAEEQVMSFANYMRGDMTTALCSCEFPYARNLSGSASDRINFETMFKFGDHVIRRLAKVMYSIEPVEERSIERIERTYGTVTSQLVKTMLTERGEEYLTNQEADRLVAELATIAYDSKTNFTDVLLASEEITSRFSEDEIKGMSDAFSYMGESKSIVQDVFKKYHGKSFNY
ncbi:MAG: lyase family protein [Nanoarchaeota archaeon]